MRVERGWTVEHVAAQLEFSASKVSRLETGQRGASSRDIRDLCNLYDVQGERRQQLVDLAAEGKQQAWWQSGNLPYSNYVGLEAAASLIRDFGLGLVPGLLQTADYARAVLAIMRPPLTAAVIEQRLAGRMARQRLLTSASPPQFDTLINEEVLYRLGGSPAVMRAQLQHLLTMSELPNVTIQVLPLRAGVLPVPNNKFIILSFESSVPGVVFVEGLTGDLYLGPEEGLAAYEDAFQVMSALAASPEQTRDIIADVAAGLADPA